MYHHADAGARHGARSPGRERTPSSINTPAATSGIFRSREQRFAFNAELSGDTLVLESDGARFVLQRSP